jgi:predicted TIM-barrel fold metal-dependent hydrolase
VEHELQTDVEAYYANVEAFNCWVEEDWGFGADGRIYGAALGSLLDLELGCRELDRVLEAGAKIIHMKTGPAGEFSPGDPRFDAFWARINEARASVAFHIGQSGYNGLVSTIWGEPALPPLQAISPFQWYLGYDERPIMDTLANLVLFNLFGRFPDIRVMSIEFGSGWVTPLLHSIDHSVRMARRGRWPGGRFDDKPSDVFRNHIFVAPYPEDDVLGLVDVIGADQVLFGSDFPHSEGLVQPTDFADTLAGASADVIDKVMYANAAGLLRRVA